MKPEELKLLISNSENPLIFKNFLQWNMLRWDIKKWASLLKNEIMKFRQGKLKPSLYPQWETKTTTIQTNFDYFLKHLQSVGNDWLYFDYKYLKDCFLDLTELRQDINWSALGFPHIQTEDCTIWIGSKHAHTPCHIDTYGYNLVHQIYGRKLWVLAPPDVDLKPTRVPYEESSVYSKLNFFSPTLEHFKNVNVEKCRVVTLEPGDVLHVPRRWWHYVENLETSISVNSWIPLPTDDEERVKEAVVQFLVKSICNSVNQQTANHLVYPNMKYIFGQDLSMSLNTLTEVTNICKQKNVQDNKKSDTDFLALFDNNIYEVPQLSKEKFFSFLEKQNERFGNAEMDHENEQDYVVNDSVNVLETLTDNEVVSLITKKLLNK